MAQLFNGRIESSPPHTSVEINYEYSRNGNNMQYRFTGRVYLGDSGGWYYDTLPLKLYLNGVEVYRKNCQRNDTGWSISCDSG